MVRVLALLVVLSAIQMVHAAPGSSKREPAMSTKNPGGASSKTVDAKQRGGPNKALPVFSFKGAKDVEGLLLKQEYRFVGKSTTYFSPMGIRLESSTLSVLLNSKTQVMCMYSDDTKKFYACDPETWKKKSKIMFRNPNEHQKVSDWKYLREETVAGMKTKVYHRFSYLTLMTNEDTIWVTDEIKMTKDARGLLYGLLKVADTVPEGIPLRHSLNSKHKKIKADTADFLGRRRERQVADFDHVDYDTFLIKKIKIPVGKYAMPAGYKRAESEMEVFFNADDAMGAPDMPDLGSEDGKQRLRDKFK